MDHVAALLTDVPKAGRKVRGFDMVVVTAKGILVSNVCTTLAIKPEPPKLEH